MSSYRPVEQLQQLLIVSQGFDSEAVQAFFKLHKVRYPLWEGEIIPVQGSNDVFSCSGKSSMCNLPCTCLLDPVNKPTGKYNKTVL